MFSSWPSLAKTPLLGQSCDLSNVDDQRIKRLKLDKIQVSGWLCTAAWSLHHLPRILSVVRRKGLLVQRNLSDERPYTPEGTGKHTNAGEGLKTNLFKQHQGFGYQPTILWRRSVTVTLSDCYQVSFNKEPSRWLPRPTFRWAIRTKMWTRFLVCVQVLRRPRLTYRPRGTYKDGWKKSLHQSSPRRACPLALKSSVKPLSVVSSLQYLPMRSAWQHLCALAAPGSLRSSLCRATENQRFWIFLKVSGCYPTASSKPSIKRGPGKFFSWKILIGFGYKTHKLH